MPSAKPKLLTKGVWGRLTKSAKGKGRHFVAVPYFGQSAADLLPLKRGDQLVVRFDLESVKAGQVNPNEIAKLIKRGVEVHACRNLHAKVFVFGTTAFVGSANASLNSASSLIEACAEVNSAIFARQCRRFVESLGGDYVHLQYAQEMAKHYRPPSRQPKHTSGPGRISEPHPHHSDMWFVSLVREKWTDRDNKEADTGRRNAETFFENPADAYIDEFIWRGSDLAYKVQRGERVLMSTELSKHKTLVTPPGRVLDVRRYNVNGRKRAIVYVEVPTGRRSRDLRLLRKALGSRVKRLGNIRTTKRIRDPHLVYEIDRFFFRRRSAVVN